MAEDKTAPKTVEELAKITAEADKVRDDNRRSQELHELAKAKASAEVMLAKANANKTVSEATAVAINLRQMERQEEANLATDLFHKRYLYTESIDAKSVDRCVDRLTYWDRIDPTCNIEIIFDSPGGSVFAGMHLYDFIQELKASGHKVTTHTRGMAASMAGILLQSGSIRSMGREAWVLVHEISTITLGSASQIEDEVELLKQLQRRATDIFMAGVEKATVAGTASRPIKRNLFEKSWKRKDWWIASEDALAFGLVDEVR